MIIHKKFLFSHIKYLYNFVMLLKMVCKLEVMKIFQSNTLIKKWYYLSLKLAGTKNTRYLFRMTRQLY